MKIILGLILSLLIGCGSKKETTNQSLSKEMEVYPDPSITNDCSDVVAVDHSKKGILVIGDSISIGYYPELKNNFSQDYDVIHNPCNAQNSRRGVSLIDDYLALRESFEIVTFNYGIWDFGYSNTMTVEEYRANLKYIAKEIQKKSKRTVFITSTYAMGAEYYRMQDFRKMSLELMKELNIQVIDIYEFAFVDSLLHVDGFHFNPTGYKVLADYIYKKLR